MRNTSYRYDNRAPHNGTARQNRYLALATQNRNAPYGSDAPQNCYDNRAPHNGTARPNRHLAFATQNSKVQNIGLWICSSVLMLLVVGAVLISCDHTDQGIFASIEREEKIEQINEGTSGTVHAMVKATVGGTERYYIAANTLYWRPVSDTTNDWRTIGLPNNNYNLAVSIATVTIGNQSLLFAAFTNGDDGTSTLYMLEPGANGAHSWGDNLFSSLSNQQIIRLLVGGATGRERLLIVTSENNNSSYNLYVYNPEASQPQNRINADTQLLDNILEILDIGTIQYSASDYLILNDRANLYCITNDSSGVPDTNDVSDRFELRLLTVDSGDDADEDAALLGGIYAYPHSASANQTDLYVTGGRGEIFVYREPTDDATTNICNALNWRGTCANSGDTECWEKSTFDNSSYEFTDLVWYSRTNSDTDGGLVIGIRDNNRVLGGYSELGSDPLDSLSTPDGSSYSSSLLRTTTINAFYVDANMLFALTSGGGLWRATYSDGTPSWSLDYSR